MVDWGKFFSREYWKSAENLNNALEFIRRLVITAEMSGDLSANGNTIAAGTATASEKDDDDVVTPWEVKTSSTGGIDYDKLIGYIGTLRFVIYFVIFSEIRLSNFDR